MKKFLIFSALFFCTTSFADFYVGVYQNKTLDGFSTDTRVSLIDNNGAILISKHDILDNDDEGIDMVITGNNEKLLRQGVYKILITAGLVKFEYNVFPVIRTITDFNKYGDGRGICIDQTIYKEGTIKVDNNKKVRGINITLEKGANYLSQDMRIPPNWKSPYASSPFKVD